MQYNVLKEAVRSKLTRNPSQPDIEKIKKKCPKRDGGRISEKNKCTSRRLELTHRIFNLGFHFSVTKSHARRCVTCHKT